MRNEILRELQSEYEQQRMIDRQEEERRQQFVISRNPEIGQLIESRQQIIWNGMRGILSGTKQADNLPQEMDRINRRIAALLKNMGLQETYLDPVYRCHTCRDTGYVGDTVREMCPCMEGEMYRRLYRRVGLHDAQEQCFENFNLMVYPDHAQEGKMSQRQEMAMVHDICLQFSSNFPDNRGVRDMMLMGASGLGKTFLMRCMARRLIERGHNVLLVSAYRLIETARRAYFRNDGEDLAPFFEADVLLLDDLGSQPLMENITVTQLFNLINERQNAGKSTIISTNLTDRQFRERYTERVASRTLTDRHCMVLRLRGEDVRSKA